MNERFDEIVRQTRLYNQSVYDNGEGGWIVQTAELKKFAELIVKECAKVCEEIAGVAETTNTGEMARKTKATAISCSNFIKNRFGVKS